MNKRPVLLYASIFLAGCVPYVTSYPQIEAPNADHLHFGCRSELGPNSTAYYPFHGIYISIDIRASRFGLHIPSAAVVELNGKTIDIDGLIGAAPYRATLNLKAASHASVGGGYAPTQFEEMVDHYTTADNFGPLEGGGNGKYLLWYSYWLMDPQDARHIGIIPKGLTEGTIEIPAMTINGQHYESQKLTFKRKTFVGMAAVNC